MTQHNIIVTKKSIQPIAMHLQYTRIYTIDKLVYDRYVHAPTPKIVNKEISK